MAGLNKTIFTNDKGEPSFMRVSGFMALIFAIFVGLVGVIGFCFELKDSAILIAASEGLITFILGAKAWQKTSEQSSNRG
jgi:hypothetical protein